MSKISEKTRKAYAVGDRVETKELYTMLLEYKKVMDATVGLPEYVIAHYHAVANHNKIQNILSSRSEWKG